MIELSRTEIQSIRRVARRLLELKAAQRELDLQVAKASATLKVILGVGGIVTLPSEGREIVIEHRDAVVVPEHTRSAHERLTVRARTFEGAVAINEVEVESGITA